MSTNLKKQVEELTELRKLNTKGLREGHNEKQGNPGSPKSLGGWQQQMQWIMEVVGGILLKTVREVSDSRMNI